MYIIDSNIIIGAFRKSEAKHEQCVKILRMFKKFYLFDHVLAEVATVLQMREGVQCMRDAVEYLINTKSIKKMSTPLSLTYEVIEIMKQASGKLSFTDMLLIVASKDLKCGIITNDKDLQKLTRPQG